MGFESSQECEPLRESGYELSPGVNEEKQGRERGEEGKPHPQSVREKCNSETGENS